MFVQKKLNYEKHQNRTKMGDHFFICGIALDGSGETLRTARKVYRVPFVFNQPFCNSCNMGNGFGTERQEKKFL